MRLSPHALARSCITLAAAVATIVPGGAATAAVPSTPRTTQPHVVGGFLASQARVVPKTARAGARASEVLPTSVDLRQYAPSPGNQGQVGSCVAWTIGYGIMGYYANRTGGVGAPYAPLFLYLRNVAPGGAPNAGLYPDQVLANAQTAGVDTQADYWQGTTDYRTPPTAAQIANATNYRIAGWNRLFNGAGQGDPVKASIKQALAAGNPVALGIPVYQDFMYLRTHAVYNTLSGSSLGGHMIAAFGYDDTGVLIRNSWGTGWGNGGDAKLSWAFITRTAMAAYSVSGIRTPSVTPGPTVGPPVVTTLSTARSAAGGTVTVAGTRLAGATAVRFGDTPARFTTSTTGDATRLVATVPVRALGTVDVTVTTPGGTSTPGTATKFTYLPPAPAISSMTPASALVNATTPVVVTGTALSTATNVTADNRPVTFAKISDTSLKVILPPHAAGTVALSVTTGGGVSPVTASAQFTYRALPVPAVTAVTPATGATYASTSVVVTGTDLGGATKVMVDGRPAPFARVSDTSLKVVVPAHPAGDTVLRVVAAGGSSGDGGRFTYVAPPAPTVAVVAPSVGSGKATVTVQLTGTALISTSKVTANGVALRFLTVNDKQLRVTLPPRPAGQVALVVTTAGGVSTPATYLVGSPVATVRSVGAPMLRTLFAAARS